MTRPDYEAQSGAREQAVTEDGVNFFSQLATHWKKNYSGWTAAVRHPTSSCPAKCASKNPPGADVKRPIECRMFRFDMIKGTARDKK